MEKQAMIDNTGKVLSHLETASVIRLIKDLSFTTIMDNPWILAILAIVFFYAVIKRSKFVLLFLFTLLSMIALIQYSLPQTVELSVSSMLPFAFGCLGIGAVLIYFTFIKVE